MNAVLEKQPAKAQGRKAKPATPTHAPATSVSEQSALFAQVGDFLTLASGTDEDHAFSGESDRLLSIGAMIALDAANGKFSNTTAENTVYDIAACINTARLVPDDDESVERTLHINNAAERLAIIADTPVHQMIFTDVPRPTRTPAPASESKHKHFTQAQRNELHWLAYVYMDCASSVISQYAEHANSEEVFALRDLLGTYCESTDEAIKAAESGDGPLADTSADLSKIINLFHAVNHDERSDQVLHSVNHLLMSAKRIVDGDLGVLDE